MQQRISQKTKGEGTTVDKRQSWEGTGIDGATQKGGEDDKNSYQNRKQQWSVWERASHYQYGGQLDQQREHSTR